MSAADSRHLDPWVTLSWTDPKDKKKELTYDLLALLDTDIDGFTALVSATSIVRDDDDHLILGFRTDRPEQAARVLEQVGRHDAADRLRATAAKTAANKGATA